MSEAQQPSTALPRTAPRPPSRLVFLLHQAERIRLSLLNLRRIRGRIARESEESPALPVIDALLQFSAQILRSVGESVEAGHGIAPIAGLNDLIRQLPSGTEASPSGRSARRTTARRCRPHCAPSRPGPARSPAQSEDPLSRLMRLRANLSLDSTAFRHAVRLALSVGAGTAIARAVGLQRGYWLPMTIAIVLKPDFITTFSRGVLRIAGTLAGLLLATGLFHFVHPGPWTDVALLALSSRWFLRWPGPANYGIFVVAISGIAVLLIAFTGVSPQSAILARAVNTTFGGALALIVYWIWPTSERAETGTVLAKMLDCYRDYFSHVAAVYQGESSAALDGIRLAARLARSNAEAAVTRFGAEPGARRGGNSNCLVRFW